MVSVAAMLVAGLLPATAGAVDPVITKIHAVQGSGAETPYLGVPAADRIVTIEGVVVADLQSGGFRGFYVQEEDGDQDGDPETSEGIFVFSTSAVDAGDQVRVTGQAGEFRDQTQLSSVLAIDVLASGQSQLVSVTEISLPFSSTSEPERYEGMLINIAQPLTISEFFNFDRFNEVVLTTDRQYQGSQVAEPGTDAQAVAAANALARITLDDGRSSQNPVPLRHPNGDDFSLTNTFRGGDQVSNVIGVLGEGFGYRIQPTDGADFEVKNPRPTSIEDVGGDVKVATFNVLNFFTHIDNGPDICGPTGNLDCRGADTVEEFDRQLAKLVVGIEALDADILGIQEIENDIREDEAVDPNRAHDPVLTLVEVLNERAGAEVWAWVGEANHYNDYPVRNDIIYRVDTVEPVGGPVALADVAFDATRPGDVEPLGRPPLAQSFRPIVDRGSSQPFTVVVNHFKSKGSSCANIGDPDTGDGQANCNLTRVAQAEALLDFVETLEEDNSGVLVIGDLNSYAKEDPIEVLLAGGLVDLVEKYERPDAYTYVFDGQLGTLDHILATRSMSNWVTGLTVFHINADEPDVFDYEMTFKPAGQEALFEELPYRVSDHDPVVVGLSFSDRGKGNGRRRP